MRAYLNRCIPTAFIGRLPGMGYRLLLFLVFLSLSLTASAQLQMGRGRTDGGGTQSNTGTGGNSGFPGMHDDDSTHEDHNEPKGIDYNYVEETDSALVNAVFMFHRTFRSHKVSSFCHPSLNPEGVACVDRLYDVFEPFYLSAGGMGHAHQNIDATSLLGGVQFSTVGIFRSDIFSGYGFNLSNADFYQTLRPYTRLVYGGSLNKDNQLQVTHTQNINPRWNVAFNYNLIRRDGVWARSGVSDNSFSVTTNYYSPDAGYQMQAAVVYNNMANEEDGGVASDEQFIQSSHANIAGIPVNLYESSSRWKTLELYLHQTWNRELQFDRVKSRTVKIHYDSIVTVEREDTAFVDTMHLVADSIVGYDTSFARRPRVMNRGVWGMDATYAFNGRTFVNRETPVVDSISQKYYLLQVDLYHTNDAYNDARWHNPFKYTWGVKVDVPAHWHQGLNRIDATVVRMAPFIDLKASLDKYYVNAHASVSVLDGFNQTECLGQSPVRYDADLKMGRKFAKGQDVYVGLASRRVNPQWLWLGGNDISDNYMDIQQAKLDYLFHPQKDSSRCYFIGRVELSVSNVAGYQWFVLDSVSHINGFLENTRLVSMSSPLSQGSTPLYQARMEARLHLGWFCYDMQHLVQYADQNIIRCPLYAGKNSFYANFHMFGKALHVNAGFDVRYHTAYHADAYSPEYGVFYRQDEALVGNYPWLDAFVTLRIKQANIYVRATHINSFLNRERRDFVIPHYPSEDLGVFFGVIWQFFN